HHLGVLGDGGLVLHASDHPEELPERGQVVVGAVELVDRAEEVEVIGQERARRAEVATREGRGGLLDDVGGRGHEVWPPSLLQSWFRAGQRGAAGGGPGNGRAAAILFRDAGAAHRRRSAASWHREAGLTRPMLLACARWARSPIPTRSASCSCA